MALQYSLVVKPSSPFCVCLLIPLSFALLQTTLPARAQIRAQNVAVKNEAAKVSTSAQTPVAIPAVFQPDFFQGDDLPVPPQQNAPWKAPADDFGNNFVSAATTLFAQGLADPRGCEYRHIEVAVGSIWGGSGKVQTNGWVLPNDLHSSTRFAVCWNGVVYPLISVGEKADVKADIESLVQQDKEARDKWKQSQRDFGFYRFRNAVPEDKTVSEKTLLPIKAALLLRAGETALAHSLWAAWTVGMDAHVNDDAAQLRDAYLMLATDWTWSLFDRMTTARMRGDYRLARADARVLAKRSPLIESEAKTRKFPEPYRNNASEKPVYLGFLNDSPQLLTDLERRIKEKKPVPQPAKTFYGTSGPALSNKGVAKLIENMDMIAARQWGQPGGVTLSDDSIMHDLIAQGEEAVEPLIRVLESDDRLTLSVEFHRDFFRSRSFIPVREAAFDALELILKKSFGYRSEVTDEAKRKEKIAQIRAYWDNFKNVAPTERWYRVLSDDKASSSEWLEAANNILSPYNTHVYDGFSNFSLVNLLRLQPVAGESLRAKTTPSVSVLLARRATQMRQSDAAAAARIALLLASWDVKAAVPILQRQMSDVENATGEVSPAFRAKTWRDLGSLLTMMTYERVRGGDPNALIEYSKWLRNLPQSADFGSNNRQLFEPFWIYPNSAALQNAAQWLFNDQSSSWNDLLKTHGTFVRPYELINTPLLGVPAFKTNVLHGLKNTERAGSATIGSDGSVNVEISGWHVTFGGESPPFAFLRKGSTFNYRVCDVYAWEVAQRKGAPHFELFWPQTKRDAAIAHCAVFARMYIWKPTADDQWTPAG